MVSLGATSQERVLGEWVDVQQWMPRAWDHRTVHPECPRALVLAWDGEPVVEGLTRAAMALASFVCHDKKTVLVWNGATMDDVLHMRDACRAESLGTIILLDANNREVTPS